MEQLELLVRHRYMNGQLSREHGRTLVGTLRKIYGKDFARGCWEQEKLSQVLVDLDAPSLRQLVRDHEEGTLEGYIARQSCPATLGLVE